MRHIDVEGRSEVERHREAVSHIERQSGTEMKRKNKEKRDKTNVA